MNRGKTGKLTRWLSCCLAMMALVVLALWLHPWQGRLLARYWQDQWATVRDEEATELAERITTLGTNGIGALVAGIASERESVVAAARQVLYREVNSWERLPSGEASVKLAKLIESLAAQSERFSPPARATAAELAVRVLLWPTDGAVVERSRLVADCTLVLKASGEWPANYVARQELVPLHAAHRRGPVQRISFEEPSKTLPRSVTDRTGHRLPSGLVDLQPLERLPSGDATPLLAKNGQPRPLMPDPAARRLAPDGKPPRSGDESQPQGAEAVLVTAGADDSDDDSPRVPAARTSDRAGNLKTP